MQILFHILMSILVIIVSVPKFFETYWKHKNVIEFFIVFIFVLLLINLFTWGIHVIVGKVFKCSEKTTLCKWFGDTNLSPSVYDVLSDIKMVNHGSLPKNYMLVKQKIKKHFPTNNELKGFKSYMETRTESSNYAAIFNSIQTILIAIIIPAIITTVNFSSVSSTKHLISIGVFIVFWLALLNAIDFMGKEFDKSKVMLRLVKECIEEIEKYKDANQKTESY